MMTLSNTPLTPSDILKAKGRPVHGFVLETINQLILEALPDDEPVNLANGIELEMAHVYEALKKAADIRKIDIDELPWQSFPIMYTDTWDITIHLKGKDSSYFFSPKGVYVIASRNNNHKKNH